MGYDLVDVEDMDDIRRDKTPMRRPLKKSVENTEKKAGKRGRNHNGRRFSSLFKIR